MFKFFFNFFNFFKFNFFNFFKFKIFFFFFNMEALLLLVRIWCGGGGDFIEDDDASDSFDYKAISLTCRAFLIYNDVNSVVYFVIFSIAF